MTAPRGGRARAVSPRKPLSAGAATPSRQAGDTLTYPVASLLAEAPGATREYEVGPAWVDVGEEQPPDATGRQDEAAIREDEAALAEPVAGTLRLARTNRGLLASARLRTVLATECSRCLRDVRVPLDLTIEEEVLPSIELSSGLPVDTTSEPDVVRLNQHHELELLPLVREAIWLAQPIAPVCREDCPGLCSTCGRPLDDGDHDHEPAEIDPRLEALRGFAVDAGDETD
ncbi:MAG TPA: DUF177 domain-containing protein [Candidatus Limnocylindrales bacterium]|nr:DUF177 domain-containing protein [Candidatus Limnocylindrales bacterium]